MCFFIRKMQGSMVDMIENVAYKEQTTGSKNLADFMRRESFIPGLELSDEEEEKDEPDFDILNSNISTRVKKIINDSNLKVKDRSGSSNDEVVERNDTIMFKHGEEDDDECEDIF